MDFISRGSDLLRILSAVMTGHNAGLGITVRSFHCLFGYFAPTHGNGLVLVKQGKRPNPLLVALLSPFSNLFSLVL